MPFCYCCLAFLHVCLHRHTCREGDCEGFLACCFILICQLLVICPKCCKTVQEGWKIVTRGPDCSDSLLCLSRRLFQMVYLIVELATSFSWWHYVTNRFCSYDLWYIVALIKKMAGWKFLGKHKRFYQTIIKGWFKPKTIFFVRKWLPLTLYFNAIIKKWVREDAIILMGVMGYVRFYV